MKKMFIATILIVNCLTIGAPRRAIAGDVLQGAVVGGTIGAVVGGIVGLISSATPSKQEPTKIGGYNPDMISSAASHVATQEINNNGLLNLKSNKMWVYSFDIKF